MGLLQRKLYFSKDPLGSNIFQGGGVQMLISIETHITCDFVGAGGPDPLPPPLWIRTWFVFVSVSVCRRRLACP